MLKGKAAANFLTYESSNLGIKIQYPNSWKKDVKNDIVTFYPLKIVVDSDTQTTKLLISVDNDQKIDLKQYVDQTVSSYREECLDFDLIERNTNITLAGYPAYNLVYTETISDDYIHIKSLEVGTIVGDKAYYIIYEAETENYFDYLPQIQKIIDSFEIIK